MNKKLGSILMVVFAVACAVVFFARPAVISPAKVEALSSSEKAVLDRILAHWAGWVPQRQADGTAPLMTFAELYEGLDSSEIAFLDGIRSIKPSDLEVEKTVNFIRLDDQWIQKNGERSKINAQYVPDWVYEAYKAMMIAMERDLGVRLYIESAYRSPAYQLYLFLFYTPGHQYSIKETNQWVALPGHSEHGDPLHQALDFINGQGVNGDDEPQVAEDFERLPEYSWLQKNAGKFNFVLSYPRGHQSTTFEPWHWRHDKPQK